LAVTATLPSVDEMHWLKPGATTEIQLVILVQYRVGGEATLYYFHARRCHHHAKFESESKGSQ